MKHTSAAKLKGAQAKKYYYPFTVLQKRSKIKASLSSDDLSIISLYLFMCSLSSNIYLIFNIHPWKMQKLATYNKPFSYLMQKQLNEVKCRKQDFQLKSCWFCSNCYRLYIAITPPPLYCIVTRTCTSPKEAKINLIVKLDPSINPRGNLED